MMDSESKGNDKNTKLSTSQVVEQRGTKRGAHSGIIATGWWISSGSQNIETTCKSHGSCGTSSGSAHRRRKEITGLRQDKLSSSKEVDHTGLDGASVPCDDRKSKKTGRSQLKFVPEVCCPKDNTGNNNEKIGVDRRITRSMSNTGTSTWKESNEGTNIEDLNLEEIILEKNDEAEFRNKRNHYVSFTEQGEDSGDSEETVVEISEAEFKTMRAGSAFLGDEEIRSYGPGLDYAYLGVASRTRSKTSIQKQPESGKVQLDLSDESSSSTDNSSHDEDFEVKNSYHSDGAESGSQVVRRREVPLRKRPLRNHDAKADEDFTLVHGKIDATIPDHDEAGKETEANNTENQFKRNSSKHYDLFSKLADSVLDWGPMLENEETNVVPKPTPGDQYQSSLPLKFRFEDEVPKQVEKTDYEKEIEDMHATLEFCWTLEEQDSFNYSEVDQEPEKSPVTETQEARCAKGLHEFIIQEDAGVICKCCLHEAVGPKDIMPEWAKSTCRGSKRKRSPRNKDLSPSDEIHLASSVNEHAAFNSNSGTVWNIKPGVRESMYKHQQEGFEFLWMNLAGSINLVDLKSSDLSTEVGGCIISHAPGTGKTRLTIVFLETYLKLFPNCRPVIIAPASMLLTWEEELKKWRFDFPFHNLNNLDLLSKENKTSLGLLAGAKRQDKDVTRMIKIYSWNTGGGILRISYSLFEKLTGEKYINEKKNKRRRANIDKKTQDLRKILLEKPGLVVLDEGHTPRNQRSNIWNALLKLQTGKRVILSGTPFQNNFAELFNTLRLVRPAVADVLVQEKAFSGVITSKGSCSRRKSAAKNSQSASSSESMNIAVEKLKAAMSPFVHVHKGTILQESLPGLRDCVILLKPPALQKSLIETLEGLKTTFEVEHQVALISVHPYLFKYLKSTEKERLGIELDAVDASRLNHNDGVKTKFILELVRLSVAMHEKVLIFSQYIHPLELIKEQLSEAFTWNDGKQVLLMKGKLDQKQRQVLINTFNDPLSEAKVMLASTRCCSEGISLVGASRVVLLDVVWNPSVERQAISRAYRIGQKKFVHTYHLMTSGTSEADKYCRQVEKERLSELVFCSSSNEGKQCSAAVIEDRILDEMVSRINLKDMFEKIINQPKDTDLISTFGLT